MSIYWISPILFLSRMISLLSRFLLSIFGMSLAMPFALFGADAASSGKIDHFTIIAPATSRVGEAIDITVEAKDASDKIIPTYRGSIFFQSETDFGATLPAQGKAIQFKESDNGVLKISK